mmetsp:Transcript_64876/g.186410  ORF Transcript_64876/g.186410 Transcript_64876/m.186410 type:complete len:278 (+) Transcript_64876:587-1420(+)
MCSTSLVSATTWWSESSWPDSSSCSLVSGTSNFAPPAQSGMMSQPASSTRWWHSDKIGDVVKASCTSGERALRVSLKITTPSLLSGTPDKGMSALLSTMAFARSELACATASCFSTAALGRSPRAPLPLDDPAAAARSRVRTVGVSSCTCVPWRPPLPADVPWRPPLPCATSAMCSVNCGPRFVVSTLGGPGFEHASTRCSNSRGRGASGVGQPPKTKSSMRTNSRAESSRVPISSANSCTASWRASPDKARSHSNLRRGDIPIGKRAVSLHLRRII